jgi:hypothetical protein
MTYFWQYLAAKNNSSKIRVTFGGLAWPAKIAKFSVAMMWPPKIILFPAVIFAKPSKIP